MATLPGSVPVAGYMGPTDSEDTYAVTKEEYHQGGYRSVSTVVEMNKIPEPRRKEGMLVYVLQDETNDNQPRTYRYTNSKFVVDEVKVDGFVTIEDLSKAKAELETSIKENKEDLDLIDRDHEERIKQLEEQGELLLDDEMLEKNEEGKLTVKPATNSNKGVIKVDNDTVHMEGDILKTKKYLGDNATIIITSDGIISLSKEVQDLIAELNGKIDGIPEVPVEVGYATALKHGIIRPDNITIEVDDKGVISVKNVTDIATTSKVGLVKPDGDTLTIDGNGTLKVRNPISKLGQLKDVTTGDISNKQGYVLTVNEKGDGYFLKQPGSASNRSKTFDIDSPDKFVEVYNFSQHIQTAISATIESQVDTSVGLTFKYVARTGGELEEKIENQSSYLMPSREMGITLFAKGKGKIFIDILTLV